MENFNNRSASSNSILNYLHRGLTCLTCRSRRSYRRVAVIGLVVASCFWLAGIGSGGSNAAWGQTINPVGQVSQGSQVTTTTAVDVPDAPQAAQPALPAPSLSSPLARDIAPYLHYRHRSWISQHSKLVTAVAAVGAGVGVGMTVSQLNQSSRETAATGTQGGFSPIGPTRVVVTMPVVPGPVSGGRH